MSVCVGQDVSPQLPRLSHLTLSVWPWLCQWICRGNVLLFQKYKCAAGTVFLLKSLYSEGLSPNSVNAPETQLHTHSTHTKNGLPDLLLDVGTVANYWLICSLWEAATERWATACIDRPCFYMSVFSEEHWLNLPLTACRIHGAHIRSTRQCDKVCDGFICNCRPEHDCKVCFMCSGRVRETQGQTVCLFR